MLKDPRLFAVEMMKAMEALTGDPVAFVRDGDAKWNIRIDDNHAVAIRKSDTPGENPPQEIKMQQVDGAWRISKLFSDGTFTLFGAQPLKTPTEALAP